MKRILFVGTYLSATKGTKDVIEKLAESIDRKDLSIKLVSKKENRILRFLDIILTVVFNTWDSVFIDVFSGRAFWITRVSTVILKWRGIPISLILRGGALPEFTEKNKKMVVGVLKKVDGLYTPSKFLQNYYQELDFKIDYLPNPLNSKNFPYDRSAVKPYSILWVRAFTPIYSPELAIEVLKIVLLKFPDATLTMIGPDKGKLREVQKIIHDSKLSEKVNILGPIPNDKLFKYYQTHHVYINTTQYESFGMSLLEAASCGIPIITNSVGEIPFLWKHMQTAMLNSNGNAYEMASNIEQVFLNSNLEQQLSSNAKLLTAKFSTETFEEQWLSTLIEINQNNIHNVQTQIGHLRNGVMFVGAFSKSKLGTRDISVFVSDALNAEYGFEINLVSKNQNRALRIADIIYQLLLFKGHVVVINVFSGKAFYVTWLGTLMTSLRQKHTLLMLHGGALAHFEQKKPKLVKSVFERADKIATPSRYLQTYFQEKGYKVSYVPNPVSISNFPFHRQNTLEYSLLWVRAFNEVYQPEMAIEVLKSLLILYPKCKLTMIGPDKGKLEEVRNLISKYNLVDKVDILGPVQNELLYTYYQSHHIYLNTTKFESFGVALVEAASCGIPIVTTSVGEIPLMWTHEENAMICIENNVSEMVSNISRIFKDKDLATSLSINARKLAEKFDWPNVKSSWVHILQTVQN